MLLDRYGNPVGPEQFPSNAYDSPIGPERATLRQNASRYAGQARAATNRAYEVAKGAYGKAKPFLGPAGAVLTVGAAGLELKDRLDRGTDLQRATQETAANVGGSVAGGLAGFKAGMMAPLPPPLKLAAGVVGGLVGSGIGSTALGWANDRVTDLFRGNDGKSPDRVYKEIETGMRDAANRGDSQRMAQLARDRESYFKQRQVQQSNADLEQQRLRALSDQRDASTGFGQFMGSGIVDALNQEEYVVDRQANQAINLQSRAARQSARDALYSNIIQEPYTDRLRSKNAMTQRSNEIVKNVSGGMRDQSLEAVRLTGNYINAVANMRGGL